MTLPSPSGIGCSMIPPFWFFAGFALVWCLAILTPATITVRSRGRPSAHEPRCCPRNGPWCTAGSLFRVLLCLLLFFFALGREDVGHAFLLLERLLDVRDARRRRSGLAGTRDHLDQPPALRRAERSALLDAHEVARLGLTGLVVRREALAQPDHLLVERVLAETADLDDDRLGHLRGDDHADLGLAAQPPPGELLFLAGRSGHRRRALARDRALSDRTRGDRGFRRRLRRRRGGFRRRACLRGRLGARRRRFRRRLLLGLLSHWCHSQSFARA